MRRSTIRTVARPSRGERIAAGALRLCAVAGAPLARRPAATLGVAGFVLLTVVVASNALTGQTGRHPQPLFSTRPAPGAETGALAPDPLIRSVQAGLARTGHYRAAADGMAGPATVAAIRAFQRDWGLEATGRATPALLVAVENASAVAVTGSVGAPGARVASLDERTTRRAPAVASDAAPEATAVPVPGPALPPDLSEREIVRRIQAGLSNAQVASLDADGVAGPATRRAIETFQALEGMDVTGKADRAVLQRLMDIGAAD